MTVPESQENNLKFFFKAATVSFDNIRIVEEIKTDDPNNPMLYFLYSPDN